MTEIATDINWDAVKAEMESAEWEEDFNDSDQESRRVFLGTVFQLYPSGKYYMPFACSNVEPCLQCRGEGRIVTCKRRQLKKWDKVRLRASVRVDGVRAQTCDRPRALLLSDSYWLRFSWFRYYVRVDALLRRYTRSCVHCGGLGSREAHLDEQYNEKLDEEADKLGYSIESGEGDPCDIFAAEYRDKPPEEDCGDG